MNSTDKSSSGPSLSNISVAVTTQALTSAAENSVIFSTTNQESKSREDPDPGENSTISTSANSSNILNSASTDVQEAVLDTFEDDIVKEEIEIKDEMMDNSFPLHNLPKVVSPPRLTVHGGSLRPPSMLTQAPRATILQSPTLPTQTSRLPQLHIPQQPSMSAQAPRLSVIPPPPPLLKIPTIVNNQHKRQPLPSISTGKFEITLG